MHYPGNLSHFVQAGTGVYHQHRPVKQKGSGGGQGNCDAPHGHGQAVHIKHSIAAGGKDSVDDNGIYRPPDHIEGHDQHHSKKIFLGSGSQFYKTHDHRSQHQHDGGREASCEKGQLYKPVSVKLPFFQISGSQLISYQDAASAGKSVAQAAYQVSHHCGNRVCRGGICSQMSHKSRIGSKADTPGQGSTQNRKGISEEILFQPSFPVKQPFPPGMYVTFPVRADHHPAQFQDPGNQCGQGGPLFVHCRKAKQSVDKDSIEDNIGQYSAGTHSGCLGGMFRNLHDGQITLGNSCEEIGPAGELQIADTNLDQHFFICEDHHQVSGKENTACEKEETDDPSQSQAHTE